MTYLSAFKAYDIRGRLPDELNPEMAFCIGQAYAQVVKPEGAVVIGRDMRLSSAELADAVAAGLNSAGVAVVDIGLCGTEMVYFAAAQNGMAGGVMVTASHNPADYNGMKLVREGSRPLSGDSGLPEIECLTRQLLAQAPAVIPAPTQRRYMDVMPAYVDKILSFIDRTRVRPLKVVVNAGNGCAGLAFDAIATHLPLQVQRVHHQPDGTFPNGIPNPLLPENRDATANRVREYQADVGIAWDGDYDRCFFFDAQGNFIEGYYLVGLFAETLLVHAPGAGIVHDPRLSWNTVEQVTEGGGKTIVSKCGHSFIKDVMRSHDAVYGGEMSAHHYFRDFYYCDSGMIPWLLLVELLSITGKPLSTLVQERMQRFPCSGELNFRVPDAAVVLTRIEEHFSAADMLIDRLDGISMSAVDWRFNLRASNTEPVIRLNVESRGDRALMEQKTRELTALIQQQDQTG